MFGDLRGWIKALEGAGELQQIDAEVDWNIELGTIARLAQGAGTGPALLFNNIRDYGANARCRQVFTGGLSSARRVAMMLGCRPTPMRASWSRSAAPAHRQRAAERGQDRPGEGEHRQGRRYRSLRSCRCRNGIGLDGGRYIMTYGGVVTKDPDTGVMNVGIYRGMVGGKI